MEAPPQAQEPPLPKRHRTIWRILLLGTFAAGGYMYAIARRKNRSVEESGVAEEKEASPNNSKKSSVFEEPLLPPPVADPVKVRETEPIPENQQRELFKWMLEEKRKIKPKDPKEKKQIDEEKAILKQFIRAKSIPKL